MKFMNTLASDPYANHQSVTILLPWYVNNTLADQELASVEQHLSICLTCKREVDNLRKLALTIRQQPNLITPSSQAFLALKQRINTPQVQPHERKAVSNVVPLTKPRSTLSSTQSYSKPTLSRPTSAIAAVLLLALIVPGLTHLFTFFGDTSYRTLSADHSVKDNGQSIRLVFAKTTSTQEIQTIVKQLGATVIGQPTEQGIYTVHFIQTQPKSVILQRLAELKNNPQVVLAEPAVIN